MQHKQEGRPVSSYLQKRARKYASAGYGAKFSSWIYEESLNPYHSCGNGSAMRVSAVAYIAQSIQEVEKLAVEVTEVTHNHPEGIKGAEAIAVAVYLARTGASKEEIKEAMLGYYPEIKTMSVQGLISSSYGHDGSDGWVTCQGSVPQAICAFFGIF